MDLNKGYNLLVFVALILFSHWRSAGHLFLILQPPMSSHLNCSQYMDSGVDNVVIC